MIVIHYLKEILMAILMSDLVLPNYSATTKAVMLGRQPLKLRSTVAVDSTARENGNTPMRDSYFFHLSVGVGVKLTESFTCKYFFLFLYISRTSEYSDYTSPGGLAFISYTTSLRIMPQDGALGQNLGLMSRANVQS